MDQLPAFGRSIFPALMPTMKAYSVLHEKNRSNIESTPREEFKYGSDPRQKLDFYTPKQVSDDTPILVFVYGGGLSRGDKRMPSPPTAEGLVYANIGHYFSVSDGGVFPSGGQDVAGALEWIKNRFSTGAHKLWIMGNSAGAVHSATWLLEPSLAESRKSVQSGSVVIQGVVLVSIPAHFQQAGGDRSEVLTAYYKDRVEQDCALGLVSRAETPITRVLAVLGTLDPEDEIIEPSNDFVKKWKERFGQDKLTEVLLEGHNHFSTVIALGTGIEREESLGTEVLKWMDQA
ncbi:unnamed protein product [Aureobasidium pullulans]|nr:unnamed protein product [Aureobasidium pullulans]